jgi:hypothetical protein
MKEAKDYKKTYLKEIIPVHDPLANLAVHMYIQEYTNFPAIKKPPQNSRLQKVDMKQIPY